MIKNQSHEFGSRTIIRWISNSMNVSALFQNNLQAQMIIKLRMEMGNVSKRQQPDHRTDNSRRSPTGLQCNEKFPHPVGSVSWPLNKYVY